MADQPKVPLSKLLGTATSIAQVEAKKERKVPAIEANRVRKQLRARLVAQEYIRNGMDFAAAWRTVTGSETKNNNLGMMKMLGHETDVFMDEISKLVNKSDIDKERVLNILYSMINSSALDFMDENGDMLSVAELKKLPRVMQLMISKVDVTTTEEVVTDKDKKPILDDNGSPYIIRKQKVKIEIPERMAAINQLAQLMRWVGPAVNLNINLNVGKLMAEADERASRSRVIYDQATGRLD